jgi:hypothetical protein
VVVNNLDVCRAIAHPLENNSPLVIDAYRVETCAVAAQCLKVISWRRAKVFQPHRMGKLIQFSFCNAVKGHIKRLSRIFGVPTKIDVFRADVAEGLDHTALFRISRYTTLWNRFITSASVFLSLSILGACVSRAPTKCELDKRSGLYPTSYCEEEQAQNTPASQSITTTTAGVSKSASLPVREGPVVAKVWVADTVLDGGHWMQGTWIFVEVESSRWSGEVRRVKSETPSLGARKASPHSPAFNPVADPASQSTSAPSTRAARGGDK